MEEEPTKSGEVAVIQAETAAHDSIEDNSESTNQKEQQENQELTVAEEESCSRGEELLSQETPTSSNSQGDEDSPPLSDLLTEEDTSSTLMTSRPSKKQNHLPEPCWYCMKSLDSEFCPEATKQQDSDTESSSGGQKVTYLTDPRPHFGVACSSHSTCSSLWGSEGPSWGQRNQEAPEQTDTCPHCHLGLPTDTLRWHEAKCLLFDGLRSSKK